MKMNQRVSDEQTVLDLEFDKILEQNGVRNMLFPEMWTISHSHNDSPKRDFDTIHEALFFHFYQIEELKNIHLSTNGFPRLEFDDLHKEIKLLGIKRSIIPLSGVLKIYGASQLVNAYLKFFDFHNEKFQSIESIFFGYLQNE